MINRKDIDICLLQEVEIESNFDTRLLTNANYKIEVETNTKKARTATVIKDNISYVRRHDLEKEGFGIIIIDIETPGVYRIIN